MKSVQNPEEKTSPLNELNLKLQPTAFKKKTLSGIAKQGLFIS